MTSELKETIAWKVADIFEIGDVFETEDGRRLEDVCYEHGARLEVTKDDEGGEWGYIHRYVFPDGSAILVFEAAWYIEEMGRPFEPAEV